MLADPELNVAPQQEQQPGKSRSAISRQPSAANETTTTTSS
jgi:mRNA-degrading endonuclease toxin of MazEF toxin-antitoxin module